MLCLEMLIAKAAGAEANLVALFESARLVPRLGHLARFPEPKVHPAIALAKCPAAAIFRLAVSFIRHESLLGSRILIELAAE